MTESAHQIQVAVCEDNDALRGILVSVLPEYGLRVFGAPTAEALDRLLTEREIDLLVLDIGLPGEDGFSVAARLRIERPRLGIVMLTARSLVADRVHGLNLGADFYFVKPVDMEELAAALGSLHRRLNRTQGKAVHPWKLDKGLSRLETPEGGSVDLTANELLFLTALMDQPGVTLDRMGLFHIMGWASDPHTDKRLEVLISRLRSKVSQCVPGLAFPLRTQHGTGYAFKDERTPAP